jgi:integrase/recombinase XerD
MQGATVAADEDWPNLFDDYDRHGQRRWFVRLPQRTREDGKKWRPKVRIRAVRGTEEFSRQYWAIRNADVPEQPVQPARPVPMLRGTFGYIAKRYLHDEDSHFKTLDALTQEGRRRIINKLIDKVGHKPTVLDADDIRRGRDKRGHGAAKDFVTALRKIYEHAIAKKLCSTDPTAGIKVKKKKTRGYYSWTLQDCLAYEARWPLGTKQRTAYALGLYLATRASDAHRLGRRMVQSGQIHYTQFKNRNRDPVHMTQTIVQPLQDALDAWQGKGFTYIETDYGMPFSRKGFYGTFKKWCISAGLPMCTFHGLRKATAARLAELGYSTKQIQSVLGDRTMQQAEVYTQAADVVKMSHDALTGLYGEQMDPPPIQGGSKMGKKS